MLVRKGVFMKNDKIVLVSVLSGAITGFIVLGFIGRFSMAIVSALIGNDTNLSLSGILQALIIGTIVGIVGGFIYLLVGRIKNFNKVAQGIVLGMVLFVLSVVISALFTQMKIDFTGPQYFMFVAAFCVYIAYGISEAILTNWIKLKYGENPV